MIISTHNNLEPVKATGQRGLGFAYQRPISFKIEIVQREIKRLENRISLSVLTNAFLANQTTGGHADSPLRG